MARKKLTLQQKFDRIDKNNAVPTPWYKKKRKNTEASSKRRARARKFS